MAEQIVNEFTVNLPIHQAWPVICDLERIAPCLPGAQLEEIEGEVYRGKVKVKLGAVATEFKGEAQFVERDDENHRAKLTGKGRDTKGRGNAAADISAEAVALSPTSTKCTVIADIHITGKVAQFGRGIMGDVSKKLIEQFSSNLNTMLDEQGAVMPGYANSTEAAEKLTAAVAAQGVTVGAAAAGTTDSSDSTAGDPSDEASGTTSEQPTVRKINGPAAEPVDLADMAGAAVLKRFAPAIAALLLVLLLLRRRK
ncbi:MAG: SRPBCC family protein [Ilumatobacteraceae bacterium]